MQYELATQPTARTFDLEELVKRVYSGQVRIPHFQRDFRWGAQDVRRLFDSILSGYPIGSLLLWRRAAPAKHLRLGMIEFEAPEVQEALWVVDGQQRITSLANVLDDRGRGDSKFALAFDVERNVLVPLAEADLAVSISLPELFDLERLLGWFNQRPELIGHAAVANAANKRLRTYAIPAYVVDSTDVRVLQDIFDRMNNFGKRLSRAEVFSALYAPAETIASDQSTIQGIAERVDADLGFGRIDDDTVLRVMLARRGSDVHRDIRLEFETDRRKPSEFPDESRDQAYDAGEATLRRAVGFLQQDAGVPHFSFLPFRYLLVVVARLLAHHPEPHPRNRALLRRWFWRAALLGPEIFHGSTTGAIRTLCSRVDPKSESGSMQALLEAVERPAVPLPSLVKFRTNEASTRVVLAAMWDLAPRSLLTGEPFERQELADTLKGRDSALDVVPEIIDRRAIRAERRTWAANRLLLPTEDEPSSELDTLLQGLASSPGEERRALVLASHAMDAACLDHLAEERIDEFLETRRGLMEQALSSFLARVCEWSFENTPPLDDLDLDEPEGRDDLAEASDVAP